MDRLPSIQALRGVAACLVVLLHALGMARELGPVPISDGVQATGAIGVDLFFVISGFVMALSMERYAGRSGAVAFLAGRVRRIGPMYWLLGGLFALLIAALGHTLHPLAYVGGLTIFPVGATYHVPPLFVGWTLASEFAFYGVVAAAILLPRHRYAVLIALLATLPIAGQLATPPSWLQFFTNALMWEFALGVAIHALWRAGWMPPAAPLLGSALAVIAYLAWTGLPFDEGLLPAVRNESSALRALIWGVPAGAIVLACLKWAPAHPLLLRLGDASYSIYLSHPFVMEVIGRTSLSPSLAWPFAFALSVALGIVIYDHVEQPMSAALKRKIISPLPSLR